MKIPSLSLKNNLIFILAASFLIFLFAWLSQSEVLSLESDRIIFSEQLISVWHRVVIVIGLGLPLVAWLIWWSIAIVRKVFGFYLLVLFGQIFTEIILIIVGLNDLNFLAGTIYSSARLWQLWQSFYLIHHSYQIHINQRKIIKFLLLLISLIWVINLIKLIVTRWLPLV